MRIQPIIPQQNNNNNIQFKGFMEVGTSFLRFLDTNQAWGANAVDLCSMVIPRSVVDFANRGPEAGTETVRREATGTANHSMVGVYGALAGLMLAQGVNRNYGIKAHKIFADDETFEAITKSFDENKGAGYKKHFENILSQLETKVDGQWVKFSNARDIEDLATRFSNTITKSDAPEVLGKELSKYTEALITKTTGSQNGFRFADGKNTFTLKGGIENIYNVTKALISKEAKGVTSADFLKSMKRMNLGRSLIGLGLGTAVGVSTQPLNIYLTKKKTGSDGFVGVPGREKDKTAGFKMLKLGAASAFAAMALSTITTKPKQLLSKLQFHGMTPTVSQLKLVYGLTIASRLLAARDKDELRESCVKDTLGFLNLLVLGALVTKGAAKALDKDGSLINVGKEESKNFFKWITNSSLKSRDEILLTALKDRAFKDGKLLPFKELVKMADKTTKGKLRALNIAQIVGYLYSGLVLGVGVPKLNIYMTNKADAKRKARLAQEVKSDFSNMVKPENLSFLSKNM